ncbi:MAG: ATP-binding protein [Cyanobacteriota bacterium]|nr:ATP-binding protein [Cyanobacteriota bacterium]
MFELLRYFSIASLMAFTATTAILGVLYRQQATKELVRLEERQNVTITHLMANSLQREFEPFLTSASELTNAELRTSWQTARLNEAVEAQIQGLSIAKVKIFDLHGRTLFSTDLEQIGAQTQSGGYLAARSGKVITQLDHRDTFKAVNRTLNNRDLISSYIPLHEGGTGGDVILVFELYSDVTPFLQQLKQTQRNVVFAIAIVLAVLYIILFSIVRRADGILKHQHAELQNSEVRARNQAFTLEKTLHKLQQIQSQLIHSEKMSSLGQMVAGIAHEINNPISFIYGNLTPARDYMQDVLKLISLYQQYYPHPPLEIQEELEAIDIEFVGQDWPHLLHSMRLGADRIRTVVVSLRSFSRLDESEFKEADLHKSLDDTLLIVQHRFGAKPGQSGITVVKEYDKEIPEISCYPAQLNQVFLNLFNNAIDALIEKMERETFLNPTLTIRTEMIREGTCFEGDKPLKRNKVFPSGVKIRIVDNGIGIPQEIQSQLFDPFFTTKPVGKGTGLGLASSYQIIVEQHGGELLCRSELGQGTEFAIALPVNSYQ